MTEAATTCPLGSWALTLSLFQSSVLIQDPCRWGTVVRGLRSLMQELNLLPRADGDLSGERAWHGS